MAKRIALNFVETELGPPREIDPRPRAGDWDNEGYAWAYSERRAAVREECGYLVPEGMLPLTAKLKYTTEAFPPFCGGRLIIGVSQTFRNIVERFEPEVHQFVPFQLLDINSNSAPEPYYFMNVMTSLDALLVKHSAVEWIYSNDRSPYLNVVDSTRLTLSRRKIAGKHIWHPLSCTTYCVSDELYLALMEAGLQDWLYLDESYLELDIEWNRDENWGPIDRWAAEYPARNNKD